MKKLIDCIETIDVILITMYLLNILNLTQFIVLFIVSTIWWIVKRITNK